MSVDEIKILKDDEDNTPAESFELVVTEKSVGTLETNIKRLELLVDKRLEDYKPESYMGDADLARKDRAELNKAKDKIGKARRDLIAELMKPYVDFEERCKTLERKIDNASKALDEIVKAKENEEKERKRKQIEVFWETKGFDLFPLEKIFNPKWLNKTFKESDILLEMDSIIDRTYRDLKTIEKYSDDAETLKAHYLIDLNIGDTLDYGEELKKKRELAQKEAQERAEREHENQMSKQKQELWQESGNFESKQEVANLAAQALATESGKEVEKAERMEFVITVQCFEDELLKLKAAMNAIGIEFSVQKLVF